MGYICLAFAISSNLFVYINEYQLPVNVFIIFLPFDGISFVWLLNYIFQLFVGVLGSAFLYTYFPITLVLINQTCWKVDFSILLVEELAQAVASHSSSIQRTDAIRDKQQQIIEMTSQIQDWKDEVQNLMQFSFLADFTVLSFLFCMCIYTLATNFFGSIVVLTLLAVFLSQLFIYCWLGTRLTTKVEALTDELYNINWYLMDSKQQKALQMIIRMTQNIKGFNGIFNTLGLHTFQKVWICFGQNWGEAVWVESRIAISCGNLSGKSRHSKNSFKFSWKFGLFPEHCYSACHSSCYRSAQLNIFHKLGYD